MYDDHYGFTARPFQLTPDARYWFQTATHRKAMAYLGYGLAQGEGFIVITGEIGSGKTTLVAHLLETIDHGRLAPIHLVSTALEADDLLRTVARGLKLDPTGLDKAALLAAIEKGLQGVARAGRRTLLVVDEAQALSTGALEELRMLSNFQGPGHALVQIFLLGQPEFRDRLHGSERLEQLRQRVIAVHHLEAMEESELADYLAHRLVVAGWQGRPDFSHDAFAALHRASGGVPRRLNQVMSRVLLQGAIENRDLIDAAMVDAVAADMAGDLRHVPAPIARPIAPTAPEPAMPRPIRSDAAASDPALLGRVAQLEARVEEQEAALRRVLTLLVDWVESGHGPELAAVQDAA